MWSGMSRPGARSRSLTTSTTTARITQTLYALFGLAIYKANVLEHSLVNALALTKLVTAREQGEQLMRDPWAQGFKDMMGRLIKRVEAHTSVPSLSK